MIFAIFIFCGVIFMIFSFKPNNSDLICAAILCFVGSVMVPLCVLPEKEVASTVEYSEKGATLCAIKDFNSYRGNVEGNVFIFSGHFENSSKIKYVIATEYGKQIKEAELGENDYISEDNTQEPCILNYYKKTEYEPFSKMDKLLIWPLASGFVPEVEFLRTVYVVPEGSVTSGYYDLNLE